MLTEEQKILRLQGLGGSDVAVVCGLSEYTTPFELWEEKALGYMRPPMSDEWEQQMLIRSLMEDPILRVYLCNHLGLNEEYMRAPIKWPVEKIKEVVSDSGMKFHDKFPWLFANVDYLVKDPTGKTRILEIKTVSPVKSHLWGEPGTAEIPMPYLLQVATYCMCHDIEEADIAALFFGVVPDVKIYTYTRNPALEQNIVIKTREFWLNHVIPKQPPQYTTRDNLDKLYQAVSGKVIEADEETLKLFETYQELNLMKKDLEKKIEEIKMSFKLFKQDAQYITHEGTKIVKETCYTQTRLDTAAIKKKQPELFKQYAKQIECKRLSIMEKK